MNVPISASSISKSKYSLAVIRKVAVSHTKPLRSASRAVKWRICPSNENHCLCDVIHTLGCQDEMGSYYARPPFEPYLRCSTTDFRSWTADWKVFLSASRQCWSKHRQMAHASVKCKSLPEWRHTYFGVPRLDGFSLWAAAFRAISQGFPRPMLKVERPIERSFSQLHVSAGHNPDKWRMRPSNANHCPSDVIHTLETGLSHVRTAS